MRPAQASEICTAESRLLEILAYSKELKILPCSFGARYLANSSAGAYRSQLGPRIAEGFAQTRVPVDLTKDGVMGGLG